MSVPVLGIDHIYLAVRDLDASERFYDRALLGPLEHVKIRGPLAGEPHIHYVNRQFGFTLRPARAGSAAHDSYAPGLHHFCFRVADEAAVDRVARALATAQIDATPPRYYPEYALDYYATFFTDPDGIRLEVTSFRADRRERAERWELWLAARSGR